MPLIPHKVFFNHHTIIDSNLVKFAIKLSTFARSFMIIPEVSFAKHVLAKLLALLPVN